MRALVVTELFSPTRGGTAVWFDQVYRSSWADGSDIVTAQVDDHEAFDVDYPRPVHRIAWQRNPWLRPESAGIYARLLSRVARLAIQGEFEAIHAGRVLPEGLVAVLAGRAAQLPVLIYAHGEEITGWQEPLKRAAMRLSYRQADVVIANSVFTQDRLTELGVRRDRIVLLHPGVDAERYGPDVDGLSVRRRLGIGGAPLILSVGRLQARKGFDRVIESLPTLARLDPRVASVRYAIVGAGDDEARLRQLAFTHNVADRVHFVGHVSDDELPAWYAACDLFAMPNRDVDGDTEGFGMVYLEAGATGKCVLAGRDGGTGSAVIDGMTGLRVDGHSLMAVAWGLGRLLLDRELADKMGQRARSRIRRDFTWQTVARRTRDLHGSLVDARSKGRGRMPSIGWPRQAGGTI